MADNTQVLREYLLSLGFRINTTEQRKFDTAIKRTDIFAMSAGKAITGLATATTAMVTIFANQMEKLYYASRRTGSTVENLQALEFSANQIGISGGAINGAITNMARALRSNPGLVGLLKSLGVKVEGRDTSDVMKDMVRQLRQLPFYVGSKFASMFGMDEDTYLLMSQSIEKMDEAAARRKQMNVDANVNAEEAAKAAVEYNNALSTTIARLGVLKDALSIALLPTMRDAVAYADQFLIRLTKAVALKSPQEAGSLLWDMLGDIQKKNSATSLGADLSTKPFPKFDWGRGDAGDKFTIGDYLRGYGHGGPGYGRSRMAGGGRGFISPPLAGSGASGAGAGGQGASGLFKRLESQYALPDGLLMALMGAESRGDLNAVSPTGPKGPFQFTKKTASEFGVNDPFNLEDSATGAAKKMSGLIQQYGDLSQALAAWNWGQGNFANAGNNLGASRAETQQFVPRVLGNLEQKIEFTIHSSDPKGVANEVGQRLEQANAQFVENLKGNVQ